MEIREIKTESEYQEALQRLELIFDAKPNTKEGLELEISGERIENYENIHFPIGPPDELLPADS